MRLVFSVLGGTWMLKNSLEFPVPVKIPSQDYGGWARTMLRKPGRELIVISPSCCPPQCWGYSRNGWMHLLIKHIKLNIYTADQTWPNRDVCHQFPQALPDYVRKESEGQTVAITVVNWKTEPLWAWLLLCSRGMWTRLVILLKAQLHCLECEGLLFKFWASQNCSQNPCHCLSSFF